MHPNTDIVSAVGVLAWAVATVVCLLIPAWHEGDRWWWPWTAVAGVVVGLIGWGYLRRGKGNVADLE